jgi:threonylcarbamoyladenosine tRNA methylthiotransferase MtaB
MTSGRTVAFTTLGCKLNQFETDSIATQLREAGYSIVDFDQPADVYVVNSCTVTNRADRKSRNLLYRARRHGTNERRERPLVVLAGCYVDSHRDDLENDESTYFVPNEAKQSIPALVDGHFRGEVAHPRGSVFDFPVPDRIFRTRSVVKVQDGCDNFCSFCIIPHVRGRATSRPWQEVVDALEKAVESGAREVVLTGVNMSRYRDGGVDFAELVARCLDVAPRRRAGRTARQSRDFRLRISSLEPDQLSDRFIALFEHPRMAPHLHLCLQSASERLLLAMRRQYTYTRYLELARSLRGIDPLFNLTTDLIVGFPGEAQEDLAASIEAIDAVGFGHVHTFPYSLRRGTRAERMPDHLPARVKTERAALVREAAERSKRRYRERLVGTTERLLVERVHAHGDGVRLTGLGEHYVPIQVDVPLERVRRISVSDASQRPTARPAAPGDWENRFFDVGITGVAAGDDPPLFGELA